MAKEIKMTSLTEKEQKEFKQLEKKLREFSLRKCPDQVSAEQFDKEVKELRKKSN